MKNFGIIYHPLNEGAPEVAGRIEQFLLSRGLSVWLCSAWDGNCLKQNISRVDCAVTVGGDGTILQPPGYRSACYTDNRRQSGKVGF